MKEIKAYKHEATGQVFERLEDYDKCEKKWQEREVKRKEISRIAKDFNNLIDEPRQQATSIQDYLNRIMVLWNKINGKYGYTMSSVSHSAAWNPSIPNIVFAPIGGIVNPTKDTTLPTGYPGWYGTVNCSITGYGVYLNQIIKGKTTKGEFEKVYLPEMHTVHSGGSSMTMGFFIDDFPLIKKRYQPELDKRAELISELATATSNKDIFHNKRLDYINTHPEVLTVNDAVENTQNEITRLTEILALQKKALLTTRNEVLTRYGSNIYMQEMDKLKKQIDEIDKTFK